MINLFVGIGLLAFAALLAAAVVTGVRVLRALERTGKQRLRSIIIARPQDDDRDRDRDDLPARGGDERNNREVRI